MRVIGWVLGFIAVLLLQAAAEPRRFETKLENVDATSGRFAAELVFALPDHDAAGTAHAGMTVPLKLAGYPFLQLFAAGDDGQDVAVAGTTPNAGHGVAMFSLTDFFNQRQPRGVLKFRIVQAPGSPGAVEAVPEGRAVLRVAEETAPSQSLEKILAPVWASDQVVDEPVLPVAREGRAAESILLAQPEGEVEVRNGALDRTYQEGVDYEVAGRTLRLLPGSSIPSLTEDELQPSRKAPGVVETHDGGFLLGPEVLEKQSAVSYRRSTPWDGPVPSASPDSLPATKSKLAAGEPLKIVLLGDSISFGAAASRSKPPYLPGWGELLVRGLRGRTSSPVTLVNPSRGGANSAWGLKMLDSVVVPEKPDLCIIAFGMNDANGTTAENFRGNIKKIIDQVAAANPATEFLLVAPMPRNEKWRPWQPMDGYAEALKSLASERVAVADVWSLGRHLRRDKGAHELTDNVNHPNDFMVRVYAQVALVSLGFGS
jgi:lysophospholipase L1-like esterase